MKIPFFELFMDYLLGRFKAWMNRLNQVETERQKQEDEAKIIQEQSELAKESDDAADQIDHILH